MSILKNGQMSTLSDEYISCLLESFWTISHPRSTTNEVSGVNFMHFQIRSLLLDLVDRRIVEKYTVRHRLAYLRRYCATIGRNGQISTGARRF